MKASELIERLKKLIERHGDKEVYSGGEDYPGPVNGVRFESKGDAYGPKGTFDICGGI
jgi:hypothetical protein